MNNIYQLPILQSPAEVALRLLSVVSGVPNKEREQMKID
jgi:hypothetical protein